MKTVPIINLLIYSCLVNTFGQNGDSESSSFTNQIFDKKIKTIQLYKEGWNLSYPVIKLNSDEKLVLEFDLLDNQNASYNYTFYHCNKDWEKSDIFTNDYLEGFPDNPIEDSRASFNTTVDYFHYKVVFPNDRIGFKISGNYIVVVYPFDDPVKPVLTWRFVVTEDALKIDIKTHRPQMTSDNNAGQQVDFTVNLGNLDVIDPYRNVYSFLLQNGIWNTAKRNLKPDVSNNNQLIYNALSDKNIFVAGNEFRYFDIKSIKYASEFVQKIEFQFPYYHIFLKPSENREFKPYFYWQDFNGKFYVAIQEGKNFGTDADYLYVHFSLPSVYPVENGKMYVSGGFTDWSFTNENLMFYNPEKHQYECDMLLKQGWYNYEYVYLKNGVTEGTVSRFEGSHYETENDYQVFVYYRSPRGRFDRLIGTGATNTLNRLAY